MNWLGSGLCILAAHGHGPSALVTLGSRPGIPRAGFGPCAGETYNPYSMRCLTLFGHSVCRELIWS